MGVDIETFRARIGQHVQCAKCHGKTGNVSGKMSQACVGSLHVAVMLGLVIGMILSPVVRLCITESPCEQIRGDNRLCPELASHPPPLRASLSSDAKLPATQQRSLPWFPGSTTTVQYCPDLSILLIRSGIELNPGPLMDEKTLKKFTDDFSEMAREMKNVSQSLRNIENDIASLRQQISQQEDTIDLLVHSQRGTDQRLEELEARLEEREVRDRRDNLILYGVPEADNDKPEDGEALFVEVVNEVLPQPLRETDVVRAHRLGKRAPGKTRPLIARVARSATKTAILHKRKELRDKGIGVSSDLTTKQRAEIQHAKSQGLFAYYKGGVLHTEERRSRPPDRPVTRSFARTVSHPSTAS